MKTSPTQRSLKLLRAHGWTVAIVERWNAYAKIRQDLFGFADLIAFNIGAPVTLVQTTSASNAAARRAKILENVNAQKWLRCGGNIVLHKWALRGGAGCRKLWSCNAELITLDGFVTPLSGMFADLAGASTA